MPRLHMTDIAVSALRTPGTYFDETTPAFGLRVGKNRKTWFVIRGRERLRTNIGRYPATSLAEARKDAKKLLLEVPKKNANVTFSAAWRLYMTEHLAGRKESDIQAAICEYLSLKGYLFSRTNNAPIYDKTRGVHRAHPKYARRGWPDICLINKGRFYGIEVKTDSGKLSKEQMQLGYDIAKNGGYYLVARSIEDLQREGL
jgi:Arm DNA-binding domain